jgi:hypothetical protein
MYYDEPRRFMPLSTRPTSTGDKKLMFRSIGPALMVKML